MLANSLNKVTTIVPTPYPELIERLSLELRSLPRVAGMSNAAPAKVPAANDSVIPQSSRNNTLTSIAGAMRRTGLEQEAIEAALVIHNAQHCDPPLPDVEIRSIATGMMRYVPAPMGDALLMTDSGNAKAFVAFAMSRARYVHSIGWHIWNGLHWARDDSNQIMEIAKEAVRALANTPLAALSDDAVRKWLAHVKASLQLSRLKAMLELAQSDPDISLTPSSLDGKPTLLGVANGVIDLERGTHRQASKNDLLTVHSPVVFDPRAKCPKFDSFLLSIFNGDKNLIDYVQRVVGYALSGQTSEQVYFFLHGSGANGKSTLLNVIGDLMGSGLVKTIQPESLMANRSNASNDLARLQGARVVVSNETESGSRLNEALIKQMTGGERITARFLYREHFEFVPQFKLFFAGNHKPAIVGRDNGIWRRVKMIPFDTMIPPNKRNPKLGEELRAELPGILNWALKGYSDWAKNGLCEPQVISQAVDEYRREMDIINQWLDSDCVRDPSAEIKGAEAYSRFKLWGEQNGYGTPMVSAVFYREFKNIFTHFRRNDGNYYRGVKSRFPA